MNHWLFRRVSAMIAIIMVMSGLMSPIVMANQDTSETTPFYAAAYECPYDAGHISYVQGTVPGDCIPIAGFSMFIAVDGWGTESCVTGGDGTCSVMVPFDSWLVVSEDNSARPDLIPLSNPISRHSSERDAVFVHVVIQEVIPEPVVPIVIEEPVIEQPIIDVPIGGDEGDITNPVDGEEGDATDPVDGESGDIIDPVDGDEGDATDPIDDEESNATDPVDGEESDATDPVDGEESDATDPVDGEEGDATDPVDVGEGDATDPVDGEEGDATDPINGEEGDATDPVDGEEVDASDPVDGEEGDATDPVDGEEGDVTDPVDIGEGDATDPVDGEEEDASDPVDGDTVDVPDPVDGEDGDTTDPVDGDESDSPDPSEAAPSGTPDATAIDTSEAPAEIPTDMVDVVPAGTPDAVATDTSESPVEILTDVVDVAPSGTPDAAVTDTSDLIDIALSGTPDAAATDTSDMAAMATPDPATIATPAASPSAGISSHLVQTMSLKPRISVEMAIGAPGGGLVCYTNSSGTVPIMTFVNGNKFYTNGSINSGWLPIECGAQNGYVKAEFTTAVPQPPQAATSVEMLTGSGHLACRTAPHPDATVIYWLPGGTQFYTTGTATNGWLPVQCGGRDGYIPMSATTAVPQPPQPVVSVEMLTGSGTLACRTAPHSQASVIYWLPGGTQFYATDAASNGWLQVQCNGRTGYVPTSRTTAFVKAPKAATSVEMLLGSGDLACRTAPHPQGGLISILPGGTGFYATGTASNGWLPVQCGGRDGYIPAVRTTAFVKDPKAATSVEMLLGSGDLACRTAPHPQGGLISMLPSSTRFYATGSVVNGWLPVQCGGRDGYIPAARTTAFVKDPKAATSVEMLLGSGDLACRTAPHPQGGLISMLPSRTQFYATGSVVNGWLPVQCGGRDGYIPATRTTAIARAPKAMTSVEMLVVDDRIACRTAPHPQGGLISMLPSRTQFYATGSVVNGWLPIQCGGRDGFVKVGYTTMKHQNPGATTSVQMSLHVGSNGLECRTAPHEQASVISNITNHQMIQVTGPATNGWLPVDCNGRQGYLQISYTTLAAQALKTSVGSTTIFNTGKSGTVCRSAPSTDGTAIQTLFEGASVRVTGSAVHSWIPVQCNGQNGFIYITNTTTRVPHQFSDTRAAMVQGVGSDGLICRTSISNGSQILVLAERSPVEVISWSGGWAKIQCGDREGFVQMRYLTFNASDPWTTGESLWIDVNLTRQYMVVYQGDRIIGQTYISSGRYPTFETPTGTFYIVNKIPISAMAGCSEGECWYEPDVPDQMYFTNRGHAFHGTYWHNDFGARRSHGCINLPMGIASWLYDLTPYGTRVVIHY